MQRYTGSGTLGDSPETSLTVADLAQAPDLHLEVVAGHAGISRTIEAIYIGDLDDPTPWMVQGSLVLTTGPRLEQDPGSGAELVHLLKRSGMVGVGVAIQPNVRVIPRAMLQAGDNEDLPVLRVPAETPFRRVTSYFFNALASRDMHRLRRSVAMQQYLLEALLDDRRVEALVRRLAELLDADAAVLDSRGTVVARASHRRWSSQDDALLAHAWGEYARLASYGVPRSFFELDGRYIGFREIRNGAHVEELLIAVYAAGRLISELADASLSFAQRLLEVDLASSRASRDARRRTAPGLLELLLYQRGTPAELAERMLHQGIQPSEPWRVAAMADASSTGRHRPSGDLLGVVQACVEKVMGERDMPVLSHRRGDHLLLLCPSPGESGAAEEVRAFFEAIATALSREMNHPKLATGVSAAMAEIEALPRAVGQATLALRHGGPHGSVTLFEELGGRYSILESLSDEALQDLAGGTIDRLRESGGPRESDLLETLEVYLARGCSVSAAAAALYVHRNTLRKRLARIERALGVDLSSTGGVVEAYLGLRAADVLAARPGADRTSPR